MRELLHTIALAIGYLCLASLAAIAATIVVSVWRSWLAQPWPRRTATVVVERNGPFLNPHPKGHQTVHVTASSPGEAWVAIERGRR
jgi:hypothetical protein